ncbi:MAG: S8 family serine peptidase [Candidatus Kapaibacterium sp.]|nr:MAG: S8 family serine peptidase [Bacteroidota bacterium]KXK35023.1 MAG: subtilisin-like serine protease [Chlorobi bacterium OLB6]MBW7853737.1 S8 family serine peptidase [Candidatus Kapabacteria bacterium]MCC6331529.1 S8 family serine peptidase [Ignavibacteria bacterium]MBZ0194229.1 S8 family serine peptidase [Candidatus Kapabacteria bacterium]
MMVKLLSVILLAVCLNNTLHAAQSVVVRFADTLVARTWMAQGRKGPVSQLTSLIGAHTTRPYVSDAVIRAVHKHMGYSLQVEQLLSTHTVPEAIRRLPLLCVIDYKDPVPPHILAGKLHNHTYFDFIEPLPQYQLADLPSDPYVAEQYYLPLIRAFQAWDSLPPSAAPVIVGIVDTGVDTAHVDLKGSIARNTGETGTDETGRDKRFNGKDDDGNGFVDDWFGWDFVGADGASPDNTPLPGNSHGTHVAGIVAAQVNNSIGIAGVAKNVTVLPIKVGRDSPFSRNVENTAEALLYAAAAGCNIINCSFGSASASFADADIVQAVTAMGALIVAAAGNDGTDQAFYPAAHPEVLSVAATDSSDRRAYFSNTHRSVDVAAPGVHIFSTMPNNTFDYQDGTSMASPVAAGVAALALSAHPALKPAQLHSLLKANTINIDKLNPGFEGKLGAGRIDALNAVRFANSRYAEVVKTVIVNANGSDLIEPLDTVHLHVAVTAPLDTLKSVRVEVVPDSSQFVSTVSVTTAVAGLIASGDTVTINDPFVISLPKQLPVNGKLQVVIRVYDGNDIVGTAIASATVNPSYRTINGNNLKLTVTNTGTLGFNDYSENVQGVGFCWNNQPTLLFEMALMIGVSPTYLPNAARGADTRYRDYSFIGTSPVTVTTNSDSATLKAETTFSDDNDRYNLGLNINHTVIQNTSDSLRDCAIITYTITNTSDTVLRNVYAASFMDWDLGTNGEDDGVAWDQQRGMAIVQNTTDPELPTVCVAMASDLPVNFTAIDNAGTNAVPGIYDNFLRSEKWLFMSSGKFRTNSSVTDISMTLGGGPFTLQPNESQQIVYVIGVGSALRLASEATESGRNYAAELGLNAKRYVAENESDRIDYVINGPFVSAANPVNVAFSLLAPSSTRIEVYDLLGNLLKISPETEILPAGSHHTQISIPDTASGTCFIVLRTVRGITACPVQVLH